MVTNINLSATETIEKKSISGKLSLVVSAVIIGVILVSYFLLITLKSRYNSQNKNTLSQIEQEKAKINGAEFSGIIDFQGRLNLLDRAIDDHEYWDSMYRKMSNYVLPEVRFDKVVGKNDFAGGKTIELDGTAPNLDAVARELILLESFPDLNSMEFDSLEERADPTNPQGGIKFKAVLRLNKSAFQK